MRQLYSLIRTIFISVWFYYLPLIFVVFATIQPMRTYLDTYEECISFASNDCIGAITTQCIEICNSSPNYKNLEELMAAIIRPPGTSL